ncbi:hypothetical protein Aduo_007907 [Ancylostoma duodenale]
MNSSVVADDANHVCSETLELCENSKENNTCVFCAYATRLMQFMIAEISPDQSLRLISDDVGAGKGVLRAIAFTRMPFVVLFGSGIFMAVFLIVLGVVVLVRRCISRQKPYGSGARGIIVASVVLLICLVFMLLAIVLLLQNSHRSRLGAHQMAHRLNQEIFSVSAPLQIHARNLMCVINAKNLAHQIEKNSYMSLDKYMKDMLQKFDSISGAEVFQAIANLKQNALEMRRLAETVTAKKIIPTVQKVSSDFLNNIYVTDIEASGKMSGFVEEVRNIPKYFHKVREIMLNEFDHFILSSKNVMERLIKSVKDVEERVKLFLIGSGVATGATYLLLGIWFPVMIAGMCLFAIIALSIRAFSNYKGGTSFDETMPIRGKASNISAAIIGAFAYLTIIFGSILFIMFSIGLLYGFAVMASANGLLKDLHIFDRSVFLVKSKYSEKTTDIRNLLERCHEGETFFNALELDEVLPPDHVRQALKTLLHGSNHTTIFLKNLESHNLYFVKLFQATEDILKTLSKTDFSAYREDITKPVEDFKNAINNLASAVKNVVQKINNLQNEQKQIADSLTDHLEKTVKALVQLYTKFLESVEQESGKCDDLNVHRPALIQFMNARVSTPVQGLWLACLIAAVSSIFGFCGLLLSTKHLKSYAASDNESHVLDPTSNAGKVKSDTNRTENSRGGEVLSQNMTPGVDIPVELKSGQNLPVM